MNIAGFGCCDFGIRRVSRKRGNIAFTFSGKSAILHKIEKEGQEDRANLGQKARKAGRYRNGQEFGEKICHPRL